MKAHELLSDRSKWTQKAIARNARGESVDELDDGACQWCVLGAIWFCHRVEKTAHTLRAGDARKKLFPGSLTLSHLNDQLGYDAVMQVLREADV